MSMSLLYEKPGWNKKAFNALAALARELIPDDKAPAFGFSRCDLRWVAYEIARYNGRDQPNVFDKVQALVEVFNGERSVEDGTCEEWPWEGEKDEQ